ncbi:unnamed protein product [Lampetra fluviatilis]
MAMRAVVPPPHGALCRGMSRRLEAAAPAVSAAAPLPAGLRLGPLPAAFSLGLGMGDSRGDLASTRKKTRLGSLGVSSTPVRGQQAEPASGLDQLQPTRRDPRGADEAGGGSAMRATACTAAGEASGLRAETRAHRVATRRLVPPCGLSAVVVFRCARSRPVDVFIHSFATSTFH